MALIRRLVNLIPRSFVLCIKYTAQFLKRIARGTSLVCSD